MKIAHRPKRAGLKQRTIATNRRRFVCSECAKEAECDIHDEVPVGWRQIIERQYHPDKDYSHTFVTNLCSPECRNSFEAYEQEVERLTSVLKKVHDNPQS